MSQQLWLGFCRAFAHSYSPNQQALQPCCFSYCALPSHMPTRNSHKLCSQLGSTRDIQPAWKVVCFRPGFVAALRKQTLVAHVAHNSVRLKMSLLYLWRELIISAPHPGHVQSLWQHIHHLWYLSRLVSIESGWLLPRQVLNNKIPFCDNPGSDWISEPFPVASWSWAFKRSLSTRKMCTLHCRNDMAGVRQTNAFYEKQLQNWEYLCERNWVKHY